MFSKKSDICSHIMEHKNLHRNLTEAVVNALDLIYNQRYYADKVVEKTLKSDKRWGARDRRFVAEAIYECVRWKRLYNEIADTQNNFHLLNIFKIIGVYAVLNEYKLPEWDEFIGLNEVLIQEKFNFFQSKRAIRESIPDWMDEMGQAELGNQWDAEMKALNQQAQVVLRTNTLKINRTDLQAQFEKEGIEMEILSDYPDALKLKNRANVFHTFAFRKGFFEMQDASSQLVSRFLEVEPGMRVVDACAGAGGKTLHLASLMENKGQLIAMDIFEYKLEDLKKRAKRNGAHNIETRVITSSKTIKKLKESADRLLIDAPCSGLGVIRRNPDSKWKLQPDQIEQLKATQAEILDQYAQMVKVGGKMVYATCSILPSENEQQVEKFLANHPEFTLQKDIKVSPHQSGFDGFYMALLEKIN
jgi:16S rRNA (cytosine967-C5)-methyltransferase